MQETLLPLPKVLAAVGFGRSHVYVLIAKGEFPAPVAIGTNRRWKSSDIQKWIEEKIRQSAVAPAQLHQPIRKAVKAGAVALAGNGGA